MEKRSLQYLLGELGLRKWRQLRRPALTGEQASARLNWAININTLHRKIGHALNGVMSARLVSDQYGHSDDQEINSVSMMPALNGQGKVLNRCFGQALVK